MEERGSMIVPTEHQLDRLPNGQQSVGSWEWLVQSDRVVWSEGLFEIYGIDPEGFDPTFQGYLARVHPDDREHARSVIEDAYESREPFHFFERILRPDGSVRTLHSTGRVITDDDDMIVKLVGVCRDVTEVRMREHALRESEARFRSVVETTPSPIVRLGPDHAVRDANGAAERLLGWPVDEIRGEDFLARFVPEHLGSAIAGQLHQVWSGREIEGFESPVVTRTGERRVLLWNMTRLVNAAGQPTDLLAIGQDITDRKRTEEALRDSERKFRLLFDESRDGLALIDFETGGLSDCNAAFERLVGRRLQELRRLRVWELSPPDAIQSARELFAKLKNTGGSGPQESVFQTPDGKLVHYEFTSKQVMIRGRRYFHATVRDIGERRRAEHALRKSDERLRHLLETTNVIPWEADGTTWQFTYVGPQAVKILGYPLEDWYAKDFWVEHIHPDDRSDAVSRCVKLSRICQEYDFEYRMIAADGRTVWFHDLVNVEPGAGGASKLRGFLVDITERKAAQEVLSQSERRLKRLLEAVPDALVLARLDGTILFANGQTEKLFGYEPNELKDSTLDVLVAQRFRRKTALHRPVDLSLGSGVKARGRVVLFGRRKDGSEFPAEILFVPFESEDGELVACDIRDLSSRMDAEAEARRLREHLSQVSRIAALGEVGVSVARELTQPIAAIMNAATQAESLMEAERVDPELLSASLSELSENASGAERVLGRIRDLFRRGDLERETVDLNAVVHEVTSIVRGDLAERRVSIELDLQPELPGVMGDRVQLQQVMLNLLVNACEAMEGLGRGDLRLVVRTASESRDAIRVAVRDVGRGIAPEHLGKLFDPFFTTKPDGFGVGLAIARSIVEGHGGELWATQNPDHGATFHVTLPVGNEVPSP